MTSSIALQLVLNPLFKKYPPRKQKNMFLHVTYRVPQAIIVAFCLMVDVVWSWDPKRIEKDSEASYLSLPTGFSAAAEEKPETKKDLKE